MVEDLDDLLFKAQNSLAEQKALLMCVSPVLSRLPITNGSPSALIRSIETPKVSPLS